MHSVLSIESFLFNKSSLERLKAGSWVILENPFTGQSQATKQSHGDANRRFSISTSVQWLTDPLLPLMAATNRARR